jgi:hypothetical protein
MKRYSSVGLVFVLTFNLVSCGGGGGSGPSAPTAAVVDNANAVNSVTAGAVQPATPTVGIVNPVVGAVPVSNANAPTTSAVAMTDIQAKDIALNLWRDADLTRHPKGSCAGCHGADFFDLARIGSADSDILRRAQTDGASAQESQALLQTIKSMRTKMKLPATNARGFRPFQPGGQRLLADATDQSEIAAVKRDIAFANQLKPLLPTLMSGRVDSLAKAKQAREELLDLAQGTNLAGANPALLNLRKLPTGIQYPLWSADFFHGKSEGTFNDWVADIAHDPKPDMRASWLALQDRYLADPSTPNFWKMYSAARTMTQLPLLGSCTLGGVNSTKCQATDDFNKSKFLTALIGQHMLRLEALGKSLDEFTSGAVAFSYLDTDPQYAYTKDREMFPFLPNHLWEVGDMGRVMLESTNVTGSFKDNLKALGYPQFAVDSIDPDRSALKEQTDLRLAWFWIGFTLDPTFARISKSNATKVGEYMVGNLVEERLFSHNMLAGLMRLATTSSLTQANVTGLNGPNRLQYNKPVFLINYGYIWGYGRLVLDNLWNETKAVVIPANLKKQSEDLFSQLTGNGLRMSLYLQSDELDRSALTVDQKTQLVAWLGNTVNPSNGQLRSGGLKAMYDHFSKYNQTTLAQELALLEKLRDQLLIPTGQWP